MVRWGRVSQRPAFWSSSAAVAIGTTPHCRELAETARDDLVFGGRHLRTRTGVASSGHAVLRVDCRARLRGLAGAQGWFGYSDKPVFAFAGIYGLVSEGSFMPCLTCEPKETVGAILPRRCRPCSMQLLHNSWLEDDHRACKLAVPH